MSSAGIKINLVAWTVGAGACIQFYQLLRILTGDTPYVGAAVQWLPELTAKVFGLLAWIPFLLFFVFLFSKEEYVGPSKLWVWSIVQWTFGLHVLLNVIRWRDYPNTFTFIGGLLYCLLAICNIILHRCLAVDQ